MRKYQLEFDLIMEIAAGELVDKKIADEVSKKTMILSAIYPEEAMDGCRWSLWTYALNDGQVDRELYDQAEKLYGDIWIKMREEQ